MSSSLAMLPARWTLSATGPVKFCVPSPEDVAERADAKFRFDFKPTDQHGTVVQPPCVFLSWIETEV